MREEEQEVKKMLDSLEDENGSDPLGHILSHSCSASDPD